MVARITTGTSIGGVLEYNEKKVTQSIASLLYAGGFPRDADSLSLKSKLEVFNKLTSENIRTKTNTMHITLNFSPKDNLNNEKLIQIAKDYMLGIGLGGQPFLVYQHFDAAHPHIHLATVTIADGGVRLPTHNIGRISGKVRKEIEASYGLIKVEDVQNKKREQRIQMTPVRLERVLYGAVGTKEAIFGIVGEVVKSYKFCSLQELNAVLNQFGIRADAGRPGTRMHTNGGLIYALIDEHYQRVGSAINASLVDGKPTLKNLRKRFIANGLSRRPYGQRLKYLLDQALCGSRSRDEMEQLLHKQGIRVIFWKNSKGNIFGVTFIDNATRVVYNGQDLGEKYGVQRFLAPFLKVMEQNKQNAALKTAGSESQQSNVGILSNSAEETSNKQEKEVVSETKAMTVPASELPAIQIIQDTLYYGDERQQRRQLVHEKKNELEMGL